MILSSMEQKAITRPDLVTLVIPCMADYVSVARLMIAGVAARLPFTTDVIEDIRMAVSEICTDCVERSSQHDESTVSGLTIEIIALVSADQITIDIIDHIPPLPQLTESNHKSSDLYLPFEDIQSIRDALIAELVDTFSRSHERGGTFVKLTKMLSDQ